MESGVTIRRLKLFWDMAKGYINEKLRGVAYMKENFTYGDTLYLGTAKVKGDTAYAKGKDMYVKDDTLYIKS